MTAEQILAAFPRYAALVVGDICLDRWCTYDPATSEPSRETGIPRIGVVATAITPGAGGTVAMNLASLGIGRTTVLGAVGDDGFGFELKRALAQCGISTDLLITARDFPTFTYTKLLNVQNGQEDQPRLDFISTQPLPQGIEGDLIRRLRDSAPDYDLILVSDQAETAQGGVVTARVRDVLSELARENKDKPIWVDSRPRSHLFRDVILKPNREEADAACRAVLGRTDYEALRRHLNARYLFVTQGSRGAIVVDNSGSHPVATSPIANPVDICGAGDSFSAGASVALAATGSAIEAARFGNLVASITVMKKGTGTASPQEVLGAARTAGK